MGKRYRKKPLKRLSAKKIALKNHKAISKMEADEETKWVDNAQTVNISGAPADCLPFTETTSGNSVYPLTLIEPRQSLNTALGAGIPTINTSNFRDGARVYLSGVYIKAQFFWPQIRDTTTARYPPFANISWAVVRELKNNAAVDPYTPALYPKPLDVWQVPGQFTQTLSQWNQQQAPLSSLLFKNMNNGHNFKVLRKGSFCLAAPTMVQQGPANIFSTVAENSSVMSSYGSNPNQLTQTLPHQFSNNSCKTISVKMHPKIKTRYRQLPEQAAAQTAVTNEQLVPLENGLYFMYWSDVGQSNGASRFYSQSPATYDIIPPRVVINSRVRFKDV